MRTRNHPNSTLPGFTPPGVRRARSARTTAARRGFTLIELLVVIAIIGVLIGLLSQAVQDKDGNEQAAKNNMQVICGAQHIYHGDHGTYADSLSVLAGAGLISTQLGFGKTKGYNYVIFFGDAVGFHAVAHPQEPGVTGDLVLSITQTCQPHLTIHPDALRGKIKLEYSGMQAIGTLVDGVDSETASRLLREAKSLAVSDEFVRSVQGAFDANHDGALTLSELVEGDLFAIARTMAAAREGGDRSPDVLPDAFVRGVLAEFNANYTEALGEALHQEEFRTDARPFDEMDGDPVAILGTYQSLRGLHHHFIANPGIVRSLDRHLELAEAAESRGQTAARAAQLDAYRRRLAAASGRFLNETEATVLIALSRGL
jgi:prepilin-type N-terminal cleavage/methylation domain-containing protein